MLYDPQEVRDYFDHSGMQEWERLERTLQGRIMYRIHKHFLDKYVPEGACVLDAGCGPGRFSLDLARRNASLTLVDLSQTQLDLARQHLKEAGLLERVQASHRLDVIDLHELDDASFDVVVCYGAVLSYTYAQYESALRELVRLIRPGGVLLISVCSLYGMIRMVAPADEQLFLEAPDLHLDWNAVLAGQDVVLTKPGSLEFHQPLALFSSAGLKRILEQVGLQVVEMAAAAPVVSQATPIPRISGSEQASAALAELEMVLCNKPGLIDSGEHLLAVAVKSK
jgi:2-polyprenyl-3-methyl-5-hydroxy-6-metoxy-1,4-benzoquinol methylase